MACLWPLIAATSVIASSPPPEQIKVSPRRPIAVLIDSPTGDASLVSTSELLRQLTSQFEPTDLEPIAVRSPSQLMKECAGKLSCICAGVDLELERRAPWLLIVSNLALPDAPHELSVELIDLSEARQLLDSADRYLATWKDRLESTVIERAVAARVGPEPVVNALEVQSFLKQLLQTRLRPHLERAGHWQPFGAVDVAADVDGVTIRVNGTVVGLTSEAGVRLTQLPGGQHNLQFEHPAFKPVTVTVFVQPGQSTTVAPPLVAHAWSSSRTGIFYGGATVGVVGAAIAIAALIEGPTRVAATCVLIDGAESTCGATEFTTLRRPTEQDPNPPGVLFAPLGYSLLLTGATLAVGSLISEQEWVQWVALAAGVVLGGAAYGLSAALDGSGPHDNSL